MHQRPALARQESVDKVAAGDRRRWGLQTQTPREMHHSGKGIQHPSDWTSGHVLHRGSRRNVGADRVHKEDRTNFCWRRPKGRAREVTFGNKKEDQHFRHKAIPAGSRYGGAKRGVCLVVVPREQGRREVAAPSMDCDQIAAIKKNQLQTQKGHMTMRRITSSLVCIAACGALFGCASFDRSSDTSAKVVRVPANAELGVSAGIKVRAGDILQFDSTNQKWCWPIGANTDGTEGTPSKDELPVAVDGGKFGQLAGYVGGWRFLIGTTNTITMKTSGELHLFMNDRVGFYGDNSGVVDVTITRAPRK